MPTDLGTTVTVTWERGAGATGHTVTLTVTKPDATTSTPTVTDTAGTFSADVPGTLAGRYLLTWTDVTDAVKATDTLEVWPADPRFIISGADAVEALQWRPAEIAEHGDSLRLYIASATEVLEDIVGAVLVKSVQHKADGGAAAVLLWERPSTVTFVTIDGDAHSGYVVDTDAAIVWYDGLGGTFPQGRLNVTVAYTAGANTVSPSIQLAARELVRHLWQIGQQITTGAPIDYGQQGLARTPSGFAVPNRVIELCANAHRLPGVG